MIGYVMNASPVWTHIMKRTVGPGIKIPLDELYDQYGKKHGLTEGKEFVGWLKSVKLKDSTKWHIIFEESVSEEVIVDEKTIIEEIGKVDPEEQPEEPIVNVVTIPIEGSPVAPFVVKDMEVKDVVLLSVRKAREILPKIMDLNLLKYAFQEANQRAGKDSLCILLRKRIRELQISR